MKWLVFTAGCVLCLISLGILAVDERDVEWEGRKALCPYCRAPLEFYAVACKECDRTVDWASRHEPCPWCLQEEDTQVLRDGIRALGLKEGEALPGSVAEFTKPYLYAIEPGKCTYCGGLGQVVQGPEEQPCPVCRGDTNCIGCNGDRIVVRGEKRGHLLHLERKRVWEESLRRERLTRLPLRRGQLVDDDVQNLRGYAEAEELVDEEGSKLLERARTRIERAFAAIHEVIEQRGREPGAPGG